MSRNRLFGLAIFAIGAGLTYIGYQESTTELADRMLDGYVDISTWYLYTGGGAIVIGSFVALFAKQA